MDGYSKVHELRQIGFTIAAIARRCLQSMSMTLKVSHLNLTDTTNVTNTLQKYLIVGVATSIGFYLLSQGVKITMSRFHLSTDYEERAQLTNVYLALIKAEENYPTEEKQIILQSIFSRSESGLIKGDSGPVMPNNILSQVLRNTR
ncbi:hypothetical protein I5074_21525 [Bacillus enclensis]|nr:hypothetical protein [[Bacillus] enclensis]